MDSIKNMIEVVVNSIVDNTSSVKIDVQEVENGTLFDIQVSKDDTGKLIGKGGRIASSLRTLAKAAGAKAGMRVLVNVHKEPLQ